MRLGSCPSSRGCVQAEKALAGGRSRTAGETVALTASPTIGVSTEAPPPVVPGLAADLRITKCRGALGVPNDAIHCRVASMGCRTNDGIASMYAGVAGAESSGVATVVMDVFDDAAPIRPNIPRATPSELNNTARMARGLEKPDLDVGFFFMELGFSSFVLHASKPRALWHVDRSAPLAFAPYGVASRGVATGRYSH